jgi:hypothetical protein
MGACIALPLHYSRLLRQGRQAPRRRGALRRATAVRQVRAEVRKGRQVVTEPHVGTGPQGVAAPVAAELAGRGLMDALVGDARNCWLKSSTSPPKDCGGSSQPELGGTMPCPAPGVVGTSVSSSMFFFRDLKSSPEGMAMALTGIPMMVLSPGARDPTSDPHGTPPAGAGPWIWGSCSDPSSSMVGMGMPPLIARPWTSGP